jgi:hypothetical protein
VAALCAVAVVIGIAVIAPAIDRSKQRTAAGDARRTAAFQRAERARLTLDQRPVFARARAVARLYAAGRTAQARAALLADLQARIARDARARVAAGSFEGTIREVRCSYRPVARGARVAMSCLAVTSRAAGAIVGQPFTAAGSLRDGRYAWCHENPRPAEGASGVGVFVALSQACRS